MLIGSVVLKREHILINYSKAPMDHSIECSGPLNSLSHENQGGDKPPTSD